MCHPQRGDATKGVSLANLATSQQVEERLQISHHAQKVEGSRVALM